MNLDNSPAGKNDDEYLGLDSNDFREEISNLQSLLARSKSHEVALVRTHLGLDISKPDFWLSSLELVEKKIANFEKLVSLKTSH